jgi:hypothetical protein
MAVRSMGMKTRGVSGGTTATYSSHEGVDVEDGAAIMQKASISREVPVSTAQGSSPAVELNATVLSWQTTAMLTLFGFFTFVVYLSVAN